MTANARDPQGAAAQGPPSGLTPPRLMCRRCGMHQGDPHTGNLSECAEAKHDWAGGATAPDPREAQIRAAADVVVCAEALLPALYRRYAQHGQPEDRMVQCVACLCSESAATLLTNAFPHDREHCPVYALENAVGVLRFVRDQTRAPASARSAAPEGSQAAATAAHSLSDADTRKERKTRRRAPR